MCKHFKHPALANIVTSTERQGIEMALAFRAEFPGASQSPAVVLNPYIVEIDNYFQERKIADSLDKLLASCDEWGRWQVIVELIAMFEEVEHEV